MKIIYIYTCIDWNIFKFICSGTDASLNTYSLNTFHEQNYHYCMLQRGMCLNGMAVIILEMLQETQGRACSACAACADPTVFAFPCLNSPGVAASQQLPLAASSAGAVGAQFLLAILTALLTGGR